MKAIHLQHSYIKGARALNDKSLSITLGTPELTPEEKAAVMELINEDCETFFNPLKQNDGEMTVTSEVERKSPSKRFRSVLFKYWIQLGSPGKVFEVWYVQYMEKLIDNIKERLT